MPVCPKCGKLISESHYQRHLSRCGTTHRHESRSLYVPSATPQFESPDRGITYGPQSREESKRDWKKLTLAGFIIFLLIGSVAVFFILYALSLL